ncbi:MAG: hypothetical protein M3O36_08680 [Myxococcota bacterium]|nr:hypothetical protein [Myxococcota bacterium]
MRVAFLSSFLVLAACGGSKKPAESASGESSSIETDTPGHGADAGGASAESTETPSPSGSSAGAAATEAASPPASSSEPPAGHPVPAATGSIDGKPFAPKLARVTGKMQKDGRILLTLDEHTDCAGGGGKPGPVLTMLVPWENGYKVDLGALKRASKKSAGEIGFAHVNKAGKKTASSSFKPSGRVTIVKAPMEPDAVGKMKIDLQSGDYMLVGELDIAVCVAPK